jgi:rhodanese-related sulfurtransferase
MAGPPEGQLDARGPTEALPLLLVDARTAAEQQASLGPTCKPWRRRGAAGQVVQCHSRPRVLSAQVSVLPGTCTISQRRLEQLGPETFRGRRVVCYCTVGYRSGLYAAQLRRRHGLDAYNLRGSVLAWVSARRRAGLTCACLMLQQLARGSCSGMQLRVTRQAAVPAASQTQEGLALADPATGQPTARVHVFSRDWALQVGLVMVMVMVGLVPGCAWAERVSAGLVACARGCRAACRHGPCRAQAVLPCALVGTGPWIYARDV